MLTLWLFLQFLGWRIDPKNEKGTQLVGLTLYIIGPVLLAQQQSQPAPPFSFIIFKIPILPFLEYLFQNK